MDGFDLGHDQRGPLGGDQSTHRRTVEHVEHVATVGDLHCRGIGVAIGRDHLGTETLQLQRDFLAELARAEQQYAEAMGRQWSADGDHGVSQDEGKPTV